MVINELVRNNSDKPMANNLMKWCKSKFFNGYKQFSGVLPRDHVDDRQASDMEELLTATYYEPHQSHRKLSSRRRTSSPAFSCSTTSTNDSGHSSPKTPCFKFDGIECDVSVDSGPKNGWREYSFTLYDFDGQRNITKDDINGLVTAIYNILGSSIQNPHNGSSNTIKVKMIISPEQKEDTPKTCESLTSPCQKFDEAKPVPSSTEQCSETSFMNGIDCAVPEVEKSPVFMCRAHANRRGRRDWRKLPSPCSSISEDQNKADISDQEDCRVCVENRKELTDYYQSNLSENQHQQEQYSAARLTSPLTNKPMEPEDDVPYFSKPRMHCSSINKQHLLEIIRENMEKNKVYFEATDERRNRSYKEAKRHEMNYSEIPVHTDNEFRRYHAEQYDHHLNTAKRNILADEYFIKQKRAMEQTEKWLHHSIASPTNQRSYPNRDHSKPKRQSHRRHRRTQHQPSMTTSPKKRQSSRVVATTPTVHEHHHVHEYVHHHYHHYQYNL